MSTLLQAGDGNVAAEALGVAVAARVPVLLWGAPGTGKTSAIRAMAEAMDLPCETVIASIREPSDFAGLPVVTGDVVRFAPPHVTRRVEVDPGVDHAVEVEVHGATDRVPLSTDGGAIRASVAVDVLPHALGIVERAVLVDDTRILRRRARRGSRIRARASSRVRARGWRRSRTR